MVDIGQVKLNKIGLVEKVNTSTELGANAKYAGSSFSTLGYAKLVGFAIADKDGRLEIQQSQSDFIDDVISEFDLEIAQCSVDKCFFYDGAWSDETTDINEATANDVELPPSAIAEDHAIYFGGYVRFNKIRLTVGTAPANITKTYVFEYWNGSIYTAVSNLSDGTNNFANVATNNITFDMPTDWEECSVNGVTMYWFRIRAHTVSQTNGPTYPKATQGWAYPLVEIPFSIDVVGKYAKLFYYNEGTAQTYLRAIANVRTL